MNEIKEIENKIKEKENEISSLERKLKELKDKQELPDLVGKYIYITGHLISYYMKVKKITKTENLGFILEGSSIEILMQLIGSAYTLKNKDYHPIIDINDIKIIDEDKFNKVFEEAVKSFNN